MESPWTLDKNINICASQIFFEGVLYKLGQIDETSSQNCSSSVCLLISFLFVLSLGGEDV